MLKEKLKQALKQKGLNEGLADKITITEESEIEEIVNQLAPAGATPSYEEVLASEEFATYVEANGFDKVVGLSKTLQKFHDQKVTKGIATAIENHQKKNPMPNNDPKPSDPKPDDQMKTLMDRLEALEKEKAQGQFSTTAKEALNKTNLPDAVKSKWASRIVESEVSVEDQVKALESEYNELYTMTVAGNAGNGLPYGQGVTSEEEKLKQVEQIGKDFVESRKN